MAKGADIAANLASLPILGSIQHIEFNQERRTNNLRREFNPGLLGKPAETYPGLPEYRVNLHRVDLYDENLLEAFGFGGANLVDQFRSIVIVAEQVSPRVVTNGVETDTPLSVDGKPMKDRTYIITGCWLDDLNYEYDIVEDDQKFVQEVSMIAQDVFITSSPE
jgi:hypothetical protein